MNDILNGLLEKLSGDKPFYLLPDQSSQNKLLSSSKAEYYKFIKDTVFDKIKIEESSATERMVDLIERVSAYYEQKKKENINSMTK
ncbi:unnamed protein product [Brachionus calyciflorus]|uniref:Uncharacterized protein n=1 Tax=Brachionus calyciflorus TaxID=104777 RepID=A0A814CEF8_9BILA|nr:unnamed protein product [Brachionus calyciflorus]